ncbi:hypothetical protein V1227_17070 [Lentzea sp. DG1S-22]|nr:hypothetical protein [Lentzea sp. DG1S-22]WVH84382.1 hypothetical protein V1227_17070 [Lentzea sp. DG1S-22]
MDLIEKTCSVCHKISWDNQFGTYHERHEAKGKSVPCDTNGGTYVDGVRQ